MQVPLPISLIVPCLNEADQLSTFLQEIKHSFFQEIILVDGGSKDNSACFADKYEAHYSEAPIARRSIQMNEGAKRAKGEYLLFLHADVRPCEKFYQAVNEAVNQSVDCANFRLNFNHKHWLLKVHAFFTRYEYLPFQFGDQGLLIKKELFDHFEFDTHMAVLEDQELLKRLKKASISCQKLDASLLVSARAYVQHGVYRMHFIYYLIYVLYRSGVANNKLRELYDRLLK